MKQNKFMGICFKESLTMATIQDEKTETRRIINLDQLELTDIQDDPDNRLFTYWKKARGVEYKTTIREKDLIKMARYKPGSFVYIKEPLLIHPEQGTIYKYDLSVFDPRRKEKIWNNKLFMKKELARYWIKIKGVKVERLHDITERSVIREGVRHGNMINGQTEQEELFFGDYTITKELRRKARQGEKKAIYCMEKIMPYYWLSGPDAPRQSFATLIDRINGRGAWKKNPWVYVYAYERTLLNPLFAIPAMATFEAE